MTSSTTSGLTGFPGSEWDIVTPEELGFDASRLESAARWQADRDADLPFRLLVVRHGRIAGEWNRGIGSEELQRQASASKSTYGCVLSSAVREGKIGSADDKVVDYYPEMMDVPAGTGPKEGRHAFPENAGITFKQLIGNVSGYMKPGEAPGQVWHYQTYGMNILCHAVAARYSLYKSDDPERGGGMGKLTEWKIRDQIGGSWSWTWGNFDLHAEARLGIFGYNTNYAMTARDMARCGLLWINYGRWGEEQVIPEEWIREASVTNRWVLENEPEENWLYGLGYWVNDHAKAWPDLPRNSFAASGAGAQHIWVAPDLDVIVVQSPGTYGQMDREGAAATIERVLDSLA